MPYKANGWSPLERVWERVAFGPGCWEWQGGRDLKGYGRVTVGTKRKKAHRVIWELANGPIPDGMRVCHHCDNPPCVRPDHLFLGTDKDNADDRDAKGRTGPRRGWQPGQRRSRGDQHWTRREPAKVPRGERANRAALTEQQVRDIRARYRPRMASALGREYGVSHVVILAIVNRKTWAHVE